MVKWTLKEYLDRHAVTPYALAKESGLSLNTVYPIARDEVDRIDKATLSRILATLEKLTGKTVTLTDILEYTPEPSQPRERAPSPLALAGMIDDPDSPGDISIRHDDYIGEGLDEKHQATEGVR